MTATLTHAPLMERTRGFTLEEHSLEALATDIWDGHVFIHFGDNPPPLRDQLADLPDRFEPWGMADLILAHEIYYPVAANWKTDHPELLRVRPLPAAAPATPAPVPLPEW